VKSSGTSRQVTVNPKRQVSRGKTSRIVSSIGTKKTSVRTFQKRNDGPVLSRARTKTKSRTSASPQKRISTGKTSRIVSSIGPNRSLAGNKRTKTRVVRSKTGAGGTVITERTRTKTVAKGKGGRTVTARNRERMNYRIGDRRPNGSETKKTTVRTRKRVKNSTEGNNVRTKTVDNTRVVTKSRDGGRVRDGGRTRDRDRVRDGGRGKDGGRVRDGGRDRDGGRARDGGHARDGKRGGRGGSRINRNRPRKRHRERHKVVKKIHRHEHVYYDRHHRIRHRISHPKYRFGIYYNWGPYYTCRYFWPYYHRKYVFISLGGYWPVNYCYRRYYWYGYHPYSWYGYYPIAREVGGDTNNYYTYNYYDTDGVATTGVATTGDYGQSGIDQNTFADVRERMAQQSAEGPSAQTLADTYFDDGVKAFEIGGYGVAAEKFAKAMELAPDDMILPFAYSQALLADEKYIAAAEVLRVALLKVTPEKEGVFYPRGLYPDEETLFAQIDLLTEKADLDKTNADLQLLLGYHLLGVGETEEAIEPLQQARLDSVNNQTAEVLLNLAEKLKSEGSSEK